MRIKAIWPEPSDGLRLICIECEQIFPATKMVADLDDEPGTFYCVVCRPDRKAH